MVVFSSDACPECGFPRELLNENIEPSTADGDSVTSSVPTEDDRQPSTDAPQPSNSLSPADPPEMADNSTTEVSNTGIDQINKSLTTQIDTLNNIVANMSAIAEHSEKTHADLIIKQKEQNLMTLSGMQEILTNFNNEFKAETKIIREANSSATTEINSITNQAKEQIQKYAAKISYKSGNIIDYTFFICLAALIFSLINLFITVYVVRLIK
jgi:hypothetical protein